MAPIHARNGRRSGRKDQRSHRPTYEASRLQDSGDEYEPQRDNGEIESEPELVEDLSSEDEVLPAKQSAYSALLQAYGQNMPDEEPRRKKRRLATEERAPSAQQETKISKRAQETDDNIVEDLAEPENEQEEAGSESDEEDNRDHFESHFASPHENELSTRVKAFIDKDWSSTTIPAEGPGGDKWTLFRATTGEKPESSELSQPLDAFKIKPRLSQDVIATLAAPEREFCSQAFAYKDVLFGGRTTSNSKTLRSITCLHALNHIYKTRDRVIKNSEKLTKAGPDSILEFRDQGFTRPKVLILLPTRQSCVRYMDTITQMCQIEQQENKKRFEESFVADDDMSTERPHDYRELFAGNNDDMFRIGIKFTRKTIKYFSQFYNSDLIIASPLGLRQAISGKKGESDFLSSIEILVVDQADALVMQNWEHVTYIFEHLNLQPKEAHGCDFSRVRPWYLDGNARYIRQNLILSAYITPQLMALLSTHTYNIAGRSVYAPAYAGAILQPQSMGTKQVFLRYNSPTIAAEPDARFNHFVTAILPSIVKMLRNPDGSGLGLLIYIPSSLDFPRIRNHFSFHPSCSSISFSTIDENHEPASRDVRRARSHFEAGRHSVMLYTERAHHFYRYKMKGVKKILFYGVPTNPSFYEEIVAFIDEQNEGGVRCLFSKWDAMALERVVASLRVGKMIRDKGGDVFEFL